MALKILGMILVFGVLAYCDCSFALANLGLCDAYSSPTEQRRCFDQFVFILTAIRDNRSKDGHDFPIRPTFS
jgi:hypothetical protein